MTPLILVQIPKWVKGPPEGTLSFRHLEFQIKECEWKSSSRVNTSSQIRTPSVHRSTDSEARNCPSEPPVLEAKGVVPGQTPFSPGENTAMRQRCLSVGRPGRSERSVRRCRHVSAEKPGSQILATEDLVKRRTSVLQGCQAFPFTLIGEKKSFPFYSSRFLAESP